MSTNETSGGVVINDSLASIDIVFNENTTFPKYNLFGGEDVKEALQSYLYDSSVTDQTRNNEKCVRINIDETDFDDKILFSGPFKADTQYTILIRTENDSDNTYPPFRVKYTDNSYSYIGNSDAEKDTATNYRTVTEEGKTVAAIVGYEDTTTYYIYYDKCGIFEGDISWNNFSLGKVTIFQINSAPIGLKIPNTSAGAGDIISATIDGLVVLTHNNSVSSIGTWEVPSLVERKTVTCSLGNILIKSYIGDVKKIARRLEHLWDKMRFIITQLNEQNININIPDTPPSQDDDNNNTGHNITMTDGIIDLGGTIDENGILITDLSIDENGYLYSAGNNSGNGSVVNNITMDNDGILNLGGAIDNDGILSTDLSMDENEYLYNGGSNNNNNNEINNNVTLDNNGILSLGSGVDENGILLTPLTSDSNGTLSS